MRALAIWLLALNLCALALYAWDKRAARRGARRVPEARLHLLALLGGWPGAWLAQRMLRHKSSKAGFQRMFWTTAAVNVSVIAWLWLG